MNFGLINKFLLFGGGNLLYQVALLLKSQGRDILVITSQRHAQELLDYKGNNSFQKLLVLKKINFLVSDNVNNDRKVIRQITKNTLGISIGAAWIFQPKLINLFNNRLVNIHGARLPRNRGGGAYSWNILTNNRLGYHLIHLIDKNIDSGKIIMINEYIYPPSCRIPIDYEKFSRESYIPFLKTFYKKIDQQENFSLINQPSYLSTYWPRLTTDIHGYIDWSWKTEDIERFICAFDDHYQGTMTLLNREIVRLKKCFSFYEDGSFHPFQSGLIYRKNRQRIFVASTNGSLIIEEVINNNQNIINRLKLGDRFYTPIKYLEKAKQFRAQYSAYGLKKNYE